MATYAGYWCMALKPFSAGIGLIRAIVVYGSMRFRDADQSMLLQLQSLTRTRARSGQCSLVASASRVIVQDRLCWRAEERKLFSVVA